MKNKIVSLLLLFAICFSILHEFAVVLDDHSHGKCDITKLSVDHSNASNMDADDICSDFCIYHASFIMPESLIFHIQEPLSGSPKDIRSIYPSKVYENFLKPPIS